MSEPLYVSSDEDWEAEDVSVVPTSSWVIPGLALMIIAQSSTQFGNVYVDIDRVPASAPAAKVRAIYDFIKMTPDRAFERDVRALLGTENWEDGRLWTITAEACQSALDFVAEAQRLIPGVPYPEDVSPSALGAVALEWKKDRMALLVEVIDLSTGRFWHVWRGAAPEDRSRGFEDKGHVLALLRQMYA